MMSAKQQVLLAVANDFYQHALSGNLQYDQKSMDRFVQLTPRRRKFLPPEAGTSQYTHFLDCSGFCFDVYYQAFGFELPSDLTWHMMALLKPRVFYYERTYRETPAERERIADEFLACLEPGDLINMVGQGNGHVMMYTGDGKYMHCTSGPGRGIDYSYDYSKKMNQDRAAGGVRIDEARYLVCETPEGPNDCHYFFEPKYRCIGVFRPLELVGDPTPQALIRLAKHQGLWSGTEVSHPGGHHAVPGETVAYRVIVRNLTDEPKDVEIHFQAPEGSHLVGIGETAVTLTAREEKSVPFTVDVDANAAGRVKLEGPQITVNGLDIYTQPVLLGKPVADEDQKILTDAVHTAMEAGQSAMEAAAKAYGQFGIGMESRQEEYFFSHFYLHDTAVGIDVLSRRPQKPYEDMGVYSFFGGTGVITAEMGSSTGIRTTRIGVRDLMPGDVILCSDDTFGKRSYASYFDGEHLTGCFEAGEDSRTIEGEELAAFADSLFGRFCWIVLRPWLAGKQQKKGF